MKALLLCPRCGARLPTTALGGLCRRCVGRGLLGSEPAVQVPACGSKAGVAAPASDLEPLFLGGGIKSSLDVEPAGEMVGQKLGRYKLLERVGEGGCGVVYVAEQTEPVRRRVALKLIKLGMDTKQVVARFEAERQALAMMDHPNIAKVLDGGTTETGRPFFVMELVRGIRITDYCDQNNLATRDRLDLFIKVCQAIQHAHQKGIIHRDIKPSNILVTLHDGVPVPKVIDFGIAKAMEGRLTDATVYTQLNQFIGTPAYMSPEQAEMSGLDIDTRSDIYSLGVLLYELLAGSTPFDAKELMSQGIEAMRKTIREVEPPRPSTRFAKLQGQELTTTTRRRSTDKSRLMLQLKGDLDWIVMKCLEKDRTRRYETVNGLAADVKRHLGNEPVVARPPSRLYEFQKAVRRHKFGFAAATALIIVLTSGVLTSTWQAFEATRAREAEVKQRIAAQAAQAEAAAQLKRAEAERRRAEAQLTRAELLVYAGKIMLAQTDFEAGNGGLALHYLNECQEKLRGWEYRYLWTRINAEQTLVGHSNEVASAAFSPDGKRIVTGSTDGTAKVWDAATGREILTFKGHARAVTSVTFSPDSKRIVSGSGNQGEREKTLGEAKVWDSATGQELLSLGGQAEYCVWAVGFSPDGQHIVTTSEDGTAKVWDAATGQEILTFSGHTGGVRSVAFSPDGKRIVTGSEDQRARVWDAATGQEILTLSGHTGGVTSVAFSQDGQRVVTGSGDQTARVWDAGTGGELFVLKHPPVVSSVAFSPDGKRILTGSWDRTAKLWDAATGEEVFTLKGHARNLRSVAFSPDGKRIITGSADGTAMVWDADKGQEVPTLKGHADWVSSIAFSLDSKRIVTGSGDGTAKVWDTATSQELLTLKLSDSAMRNVAAVWGVAFSPDGKRIVTGGNDRMARVWDTATGQELLSLSGHADRVWGVGFSPDGRHIVTASDDQTAKVWDAATGQEILSLRGHTGGVHGVAFSPDGQRILTGSEDQTAKVWNTATGQEILTLRGHAGGVWSVAFSPDGKRLVTGSFDQTAKVWDTMTGRELLALTGHTDYIRSVAFSPDGTRIVTGSDDWTAKVWEAATGQELLALKQHGQSVWSVAFSPDGQRIVTGMAGAGATAKIWFAATPPQIPAREQSEQIGQTLGAARVDQREQAVK